MTTIRIITPTNLSTGNRYMGVIQHTTVLTAAIDGTLNEGVIINGNLCVVDKSQCSNEHHVSFNILEIVFDIT